MSARFVELHARSAFSFLRGASRPEDLMQRAAELGMTHLALTDRDGVYGSARAHYRAKELGMDQAAIVGAELTMEDESVLPVLVRTRNGYENLCQLLTRAKLRAAKNESRIAWHELEEFADGHIALTGDEEGPVQRLLSQPKADAVNVNLCVERLTRIFGRNNIFLELQRHRVRGESLRLRQLMELAERHHLMPIASNGVCYATSERRMLLDAFTCLRHHTTLDEAGLVLAPNSQRYLKSAAQMHELFADVPHAVENTLRVADGIEFTLEKLGYEFPEHPAPAGHDQDSFLRHVTYAGAKERYKNDFTSKVKQQLERELALIRDLGFSGYFLIVWDIVNFAREKGILIQGRGSAANSAVCYSLGITNAEPIKNKLLFERFLSEGHTSWPDIDLDLPSGDQRERVIQEMYRRFAPYGAAMTANVITYRGRSSMREMAKVLGLPPDVMARFSSLYANGDFPHTLGLKDQLQQAGVSQAHPRLPSLVRLCQMARGLPRHLGQHSGGMVLCSRGLDKIVPLENASMPGRKVVQWDKDDCEDLGIIKVDLLGLGMMAVLEDTIAMCQKRQRPVDLAHLPQDDKPTYEMMQRADTIGVFQIESRAQMATLPRMKPECFYDVVIEVAIIRPGPIVGHLVHPYLKRRSGKEKVDYIHPDFEEVLQRTKGVPLFQEQILKMAMIIADFSGGEAEELRRAMSFHRSEERMMKVMAKLRDAMQRKDVDPVVQERVVKSIQSFALYGFPESHAISFALLAYASAWLRVHRLAEFTAGLLNNQPMGFYSRATLVRDAKQHGLRIKPVCVVQSEVGCTVEDDRTIRLGLNQLKGFSNAGAEHIVKERTMRPWRDLDDFRLRCDLSKDERRVLAKSGALNALRHHRRSALWEIESEREMDLFSLAHSGRLKPALQHAQACEGVGVQALACQEQSPEYAPSSPLTPMSPMERLSADYDVQSLSTGPHPMRFLRDTLKDVKRAVDLRECKHGQRVKIAGMVICRQRPGTAKGHVFISLEDETGIANAFVHSDTFEANRLVITQEPFLSIHGRLQKVEGVISVYAMRIEALHFEHVLGAESHDFH
jgi:error-prone DNA polymerase